MSLCDCKYLYPRCEFHYCGKRADWSIMVPASWKMPLRLVPKFFCTPCLGYFVEAWKKPIKGIDRPEHAPDDWKPSILESIRHAEIAIAFEERDKRQVQQVQAQRKPDPRWVEIVNRMCGDTKTP